jgi:hypothetical protein
MSMRAKIVSVVRIAAPGAAVSAAALLGSVALSGCGPCSSYAPSHGAGSMRVQTIAVFDPVHPDDPSDPTHEGSPTGTNAPSAPPSTPSSDCSQQ